MKVKNYKTELADLLSSTRESTMMDNLQVIIDSEGFDGAAFVESLLNCSFMERPVVPEVPEVIWIKERAQTIYKEIYTLQWHPFLLLENPYELNLRQLRALSAKLLSLPPVSFAERLKDLSLKELQDLSANAIKEITTLKFSGKKLAIDEDAATFATPKDRLDAIIADINAEKLPIHRYHELLYENLYDGASSRTFLAYALPKLLKPTLILEALESQLGDKKQLGLYLETQLLLEGHQSPITIKELYFKDFGDSNEADRVSLTINHRSALRSYIPESKAEWLIDKMSAEEIYNAIADSKLPILYLDLKEGYKSTLNYLSGLERNKDLINYLIDKAISSGIKNPAARKVLSYLSKCNLEENHKDRVIHDIGENKFKLRDISLLSMGSLDILASCASPQEILKASMEQEFNNELFVFYMHNIGPTKEAIESKFGYLKRTPLHFAVINGLVNEFNKILTAPEAGQGKLLRAKDRDGRTVLYFAVRGGQVEIVKPILAMEDGRKSISDKDKEGDTVMHLASRLRQPCANAEIMGDLLATNEGIDNLIVQNSKGETPLFCETGFGSIENIEAMLNTKQGKEAINIPDCDGALPIHRAAAKDNVEKAEAILNIDHSCLSVADKRWGSTPLHIAAHHGYAEMVKIMLKSQTGIRSLSIKDLEHKTPLCCAIERCQVAVVEEILAYDEGKDTLGSVDKDKRLPLELAETNLKSCTNYTRPEQPEGYTKIIKIIKETEEAHPRIKGIASAAKEEFDKAAALAEEKKLIQAKEKELLIKELARQQKAEEKKAKILGREQRRNAREAKNKPIYKAALCSVIGGLVGYMLPYALRASAVMPQDNLLSKVITTSSIFVGAILGGYFSIDAKGTKANADKGRG